MAASTINSESFAEKIEEGTTSSISKLDLSLAYLQKSPTATAALKTFLSKPMGIVLSDGSTGKRDAYIPSEMIYPKSGESAGGKVHWNASMTVIAEDENHVITGYQSPALCLLHEIFHAIDPDLFGHRRVPVALGRANGAEAYAIDQANIAAQELGEPIRYFHSPRKHPSRAENASRILWVDNPLHFYIGSDLDIAKKSNYFNEYDIDALEYDTAYSLSSIDEQHLKHPDRSLKQTTSYRVSFINRWKPEHGGKLVKAQSVIENKPPEQNPSPLKSVELPKPPKTPKPKPQPGDGLLAVIEGIRDVHAWLTTPAAPTLKAPPPPLPSPSITKIKTNETAPPFDLQNIVRTMEKLGLKVSAKLLKKWFSNPLNYPLSAVGKRFGIQQDRTLYPEWAIDTDTVRMDWVLSKEYAKTAYGKMLDDSFIYSDKAIRAMLKIARRYSESRYIDSYRECDGSIQEIHRRFQFQSMPIDLSKNYTDLGWFGNRLDGLATEDLFCALGDFSFYAAIAEAEVVTRHYRSNKFLEVHKIFIYVRSPFSFFDDEVDVGTQYLGHWNKNAVRLIPASQPIFSNTPKNYFDHSFRTDDGDFFYPIHNRDFRAWQYKHQQGGDMIVYSDLRKHFPGLLPLSIH